MTRAGNSLRQLVQIRLDNPAPVLSTETVQSAPDSTVDPEKRYQGRYRYYGKHSGVVVLAENLPSPVSAPH
jgi:hypothetical protein